MMRPLALTIGEPAGIGPDIAIAAWQRRAALALPPFYLLGDRQFIARRAAQLGADIPLAEVEPERAAAAFAAALPIVPLGVAITAAPGKPDAMSAPAAIAAIRRAVGDVAAGRAPGIGDQSGREIGSLRVRLCRARPHRISRARWRANFSARRPGR